MACPQIALSNILKGWKPSPRLNSLILIQRRKTRSKKHIHLISSASGMMEDNNQNPSNMKVVLLITAKLLSMENRRKFLKQSLNLESGSLLPYPIAGYWTPSRSCFDGRINSLAINGSNGA